MARGALAAALLALALLGCSAGDDPPVAPAPSASAATPAPVLHPQDSPSEAGLPVTVGLVLVAALAAAHLRVLAAVGRREERRIARTHR